MHGWPGLARSGNVFHEQFPLNDDNKAIDSGDLHGVVLSDSGVESEARRNLCFAVGKILE